MENSDLREILNIEMPIIMAPMFLITNTKMILAAAKAGIAGCIPAHNSRTIKDLKKTLKEIDENCSGPYGINLIVNKSNPGFRAQLEACLNSKASFFITSLGNPKEVIQKAHEKGIKVFCDVIDESYAKKVEELGADALIAVNSHAGGHLGPLPAEKLIPLLKKTTSLPVISAGGVGTGKGIKEMMDLGAAGVSMGSIFIATDESPVSQDYKKACVDYGKNDIVVTTKLSGTPCTVIKTPYVEKIGTKQNFLERLLNKNKKLKKYVKMLTFYKGMKSLQKAAFSATYQTLWCAGETIEYTKKIESLESIVNRLKDEYNQATQ